MVRQLLRVVAGIWLVSQLAGVCAAPIAFAIVPVHAAADDETACCPGLKPGQVCPMHHTREGMRKCLMRNACGSSDAMLVALTFGTGVLPDIGGAIADFQTAPSPVARSASAIHRPAHPDSPPPRA